MDIELVAAAAISLYTTYTKYIAIYRRHFSIKKRTRKRRCWMQAIHQERTRNSMNNRLAELLTEPTGQYFIHMSSSDFEYLLQNITPIIQKQDTCWRDSIPAKIRLAVTLRFLATGDSYTSLHKFFKISNSLVSRIIPEVCNAFNVVLKDIIRMPASPEEWLTKTKGFGFPNCIGALEGKHVMIWSPAHTGPEDMNYQGSFSIVLLTLVDNDYSFMYVDATQSSNNDYNVLTQSELWDKICMDSLNLPSDMFLYGEPNMPYVFLSNGKFPLSEHIMKPYNGHYVRGTPEYLYNQTLLNSHAVVDNAFGVLSTVFKVLLKPISLEPKKCLAIIRSCLFLHNFLIKSDTSRDIYIPPGSVDIYNGELVSLGSWRHCNQDHFLPLQALPCLPEENSVRIRQNFLSYIFRNSMDNH